MNSSQFPPYSDNFTNLTELCRYSINSVYSSQFTACLRSFLSESIALTVINALMILITVIANTIVIYLLVNRSCTRLIFDRILISHAVVNLLTNLLDLPFYHMQLIFNYFPFDKYTCFVHLIIDHSTSTIEISHFIYMSYARLRCILAPRSYQNEMLIKYPKLIIALIWSGVTIFWTPIVYFFSFSIYIEGDCAVTYGNKYMGITTVLIGYILPLCFTIGTSNFVLISISRSKNFIYKPTKSLNTIRDDTKNSTSTRVSLNASFYLSHIKKIVLNNPQVKLSIITIVFNVCYFPYSTMLVVDAVCSCAGYYVYVITEMFCFSASMWNPILILILNFKYFTKKV